MSSEWDVFDPSAGVAYYEVRFEWLAWVLSRRRHLTYNRRGEGYVLVSDIGRLGKGARR